MRPRKPEASVGGTGERSLQVIIRELLEAIKAAESALKGLNEALSNYPMRLGENVRESKQ